MSNRENLLTLICYTWLAACFAFTLTAIALWGNNWLDSDLAAELILSHLLAKEGKLLTDNWFYSTELRVLNSQIIWSLLFKFLDDWHTVRVIGTGVCYGILLCSYLYLAKSIKLTKRVALFSASFLFIPTSHQYLMYGLNGLYYISYITISFFIYGLFMTVINTKKIYSIILVLILSFITAIGGLRYVLNIYLPIFLTAIFVLLKKYSNHKGISKDGIFNVFVGTLILACGTGGAFINHVLHKYFYFHAYDPQFVNFKFVRIEQIIGGALGVFGFYSNTKLFSPLILNNITALMLLCGTLFSIYTLQKKNTERNCIYLSSFLAINFLLITGVYLFSDMEYETRYLLPILIYCIPLFSLCYQYSKRSLVKYFIISCAALLIISTHQNYSKIIYQNPSAHDIQVVKFLLDNDIHKGYATFWSSNNIVGLSNGKIKSIHFSNIINKDNNNMSLSDRMRWLTTVSDIEKKPEGKFYLLLTHDEFKHWQYSKYLDDKYLKYENKKYRLYVFDSPQPVEQLFEKTAR